MSDIDEVKSRLNIVDIVGARVTLKKAGRNFKGLCPFHNEKTPSFMVSPDRQVFHCFGCGKGGSAIDFVMEYEHLDFYEALETLADRVGVKLTHVYGDSPEHKLREQLYEINKKAADYYHYLLTKHPLGQKAMLYLKNRGVTDKAIVTFGLGYSPNSWDGLYSYLKKKGYADELMEKAGLVLRRNQFGSGRGYYDRFRGRVMFTLRDHRGSVCGFSGRVLDPTEKEAKYINTAETPVYVKSNMLFGLDVTKDAIAKANEAVVMEGELDVISSFQAGIGNVVAIKGSALTEGHVVLLKRFCERIVFCLDSDMAGDAASRRGIEIADKAGLDMRVCAIPSGKDPDEAARDNPAALKKAIKDATPVYDYFLSSVAKRYDITSAFGKKKAAEELLPVIAKIDNTIVQAHYVKKTAEALNVSEETVTEGMKRARKMILTENLSRPDVAGTDKEEEVLTSSQRLELYVLALLLQGETQQLTPQFFREITQEDLTNAAVARIVGLLLPYIEALPEGTPFSVGDFAAHIPNELMPVLDEANLWDLSNLDDEPGHFTKEWTKAMRDLRKNIVKRTIRTLITRMKTETLDDNSLETLQKELAQRSGELKALEKSA